MLVEVRVPLTANLGIHVAVNHNGHNCERHNKNVSGRGQHPEPLGGELRFLIGTRLGR